MNAKWQQQEVDSSGNSSSVERIVWDRVWGQDEVALGLLLGYRSSFELNRSDDSPIKVIPIPPTSPCILK